MTNFIVPQGTRIIENNAFSTRKDLIDVFVPKSVIKLEQGHFITVKI